MKIVIFFSALLFVAIFGCRGTISSKDLAGTYLFTINSRPTTDSLFVLLDNTYEHKFYTSDGKLFENSGTWKYDSGSNEIVFRSFVFFNNNGPANAPGYWVSKIKAENDEVRLIFSDEENRHYFKLKK